MVVLFTFGVTSASRASSGHQQQRRAERRSKAIQVLKQLAQGGCDLNHFRQICMNAQRGKRVKQEEVLALTGDATILENVSYLIGLYARSATTRGLVDRAAAIGISKFLRELGDLQRKA